MFWIDNNPQFLPKDRKDLEVCMNSKGISGSFSGRRWEWNERIQLPKPLKRNLVKSLLLELKRHTLCDNER